MSIPVVLYVALVGELVKWYKYEVVGVNINQTQLYSNYPGVLFSERFAFTELP